MSLGASPMSEPMFLEVRGEPLSGLVLRAMREAIIDGRMAPGDNVNEVELAKQFGVSRAPIREAIRQLESEGLVVRVAYRGTAVSPLTAKSITELQGFRRLIETHAAAAVLEKGSQDDIDAIAGVVTEMERAASTGDMIGVNAADVRFHTLIVEAADNELLLEVWKTYVQRIRRALALRNRLNSNLDNIVGMHRDLLDAFRARDLDRVKACYAVHGTDLVLALGHMLDPDDRPARTPA
jgi:DNA-binding GntR family transcriptional regulator